MGGRDNDEMINDEQIAKEMKYEKLCASGNCSSMPQKQKMQIRVIDLYLKNWKAPNSQVLPGKCTRDDSECIGSVFEYTVDSKTAIHTH